MTASAKSRSEAMGLVHNHVRLAGGLKGILLEADLPLNAPARIINGKVSEKTANFWRKTALEALNSLPAYHKGRTRRNNYQKSTYTAKLSKKPMQNRHTEDDEEFVLTKGTLLQISCSYYLVNHQKT